MNVISFDVGIKNMAYCIFSIENKSFSIKDWNVLNLMDEKQETKKCNCILNKKKNNNKNKLNKKQNNKLVVENIEPKECSTIAKYVKGSNYYCEKHAKIQSDYIQYNKECSPIQLKKKKLDELKTLCNEYLITHDENNCAIQYSNKKDILNVLQVFYNTNILEPLKEIKLKTAGETDIISIGRKMQRLLDENPHIREITHVIIENQISPIANRMKTIQGMLAQYFIMKECECSHSIHIEFVSSFNKLKDFSHLRTIEEENIETNKYKNNKRDGIIVSSAFLTNNSHLSTWIEKMNCKKKDDLADCFLQGIWYLKSKSIIQYSKECVLE